MMSSNFFHFFKIQILDFGFLGGRVKGQKLIHNYQFQSVTLYSSRNVDHINIFGTEMENKDASKCLLYFLKKIHCKYQNSYIF